MFVPCQKPNSFVGDECVLCPPPAVTAAKSCFPEFVLPEPQDGCLGKTEAFGRFACLAGEGNDCSCKPEDCSAELSCYGDGTCPPEVLRANPDAVCYPVREEHVGWYGLDQESCTCGCTRCMTTCDGKGAIFGYYDDDEGLIPTFGYPRLLLGDLLPPSGRFGLYIRARGCAPSLIVAVSSAPDLAELQSGYLLPIITDFDEFVAYGPDEDGLPIDGLPIPYAYGGADARPDEVLFVLGQRDEQSQTSTPNYGILEIDCVIPFVAPL